MATFREQKEFVDDLKIREGETRRVNCPFCGGTKTFTADRLSGKVFWNCYRASCPTKGTTDTEMSPDTIRKRLDTSAEIKVTRRTAPIPTHLSNIQHHPKAIEYLNSVNSMYAVEQKYISVKYSPAENRVMFFTQDMQGCVGRALDRRRPKWKVYGTIDGILSVGVGRTAVVVEDAASACAISVLPKCSGCALLGTHATTLAKRQLRDFDEVIIALDKGASRKALSLKSQFEGRIKTKVVFLEQDLKYATEKDLEVLL